MQIVSKAIINIINVFVVSFDVIWCGERHLGGNWDVLSELANHSQCKPHDMVHFAA